jgi:predicted GH43/DUF377 family glycosyl hydrolase
VVENMIAEIKKGGTEVENQYGYGSDESLVKYAIENGGSIHPLLIDSAETNGTGLMNPSILNLNGKLIVNIRHVNYTFYHSEKKLFQHPWGPLTYLHPENDMHLRTWNFYGELNENLELTRVTKIDTSRFDTYEPMWDFVGLEDARLVEWDGKLFISGVRRDTTTNGQGRMELSEIVVSDEAVTEVSRFRIPPPKDKNSYCEKNWMPVIDQDYTYIKWSNPTEVVVAEPITKDCRTTHLGQYVQIPNDLRGGSQVIPFGEDHYIALTHEVDLFKSESGRKDAVYRHRFVLWDKNWQIVKFTKDFSMMNGHVEFAVGMCYYNDDVLITFGFQDNAAFVLRLSKEKLVNFINDN